MKKTPPPVPPKPKSVLLTPSKSFTAILSQTHPLRDSGISVDAISPGKHEKPSPKPDRTTTGSVKKLAEQFSQLNYVMGGGAVEKPKVPPKPAPARVKIVTEECELANGNLDLEDCDNIYDDVFLSDDDEGYYAQVPAVEPETTQLDCPPSPRNAVEEFLQNERKYVTRLGEYIEQLIPVMYQPNLPQGLRFQKNNIFANIESIHAMHRDVLLPRLEQCDSCPGRIADLVTALIENDDLYCYVLYAMNKHRSERICDANAEFLQNIFQNLNKFLVEPIQRLPRYKLLLIEIYKGTLRAADTSSIRRDAAALCKAESALSDLIELVDAAVSLSDILPDPDIASGSTAGPQTLTYHEDVPLALVLRPDASKKSAPKNPINLLYQGNLKKFMELPVYDYDERRKYTSKIFIFEKLLLYTEKKSKLEYRGHYFDCELNYRTESRNKVLLFSKHPGTQDLQVMATDPARLKYLTDCVHIMREKHVYYQAVEFIAHKEHERRHSIASQLMLEELQHEEQVLEEDEEWDIEAHISALVSCQQQFCHVLQTNMDFYLPKETRDKPGVASFVEVFCKMYKLHINQILPDIVHVTSPEEMCKVFQAYLQGDVLSSIYFEYLREFKKAISIISIHRTPATFNNLVAPKAEDFTYLCVDHLREYCRFFEKLSVRMSEASSCNLPIDMDLFRQLAITQTEMAKFVANVKQNYRLFRLDDRAVECGMVKYSELVRLDRDEGEFLGCRLFVSERAAICVAIQTIQENEKSSERYVRIVFIDQFGGRATPIKLRKSKKTELRLNFVIDGIKFKVWFHSRQAKERFYNKYIDSFVLIK